MSTGALNDSRKLAALLDRVDEFVRRFVIFDSEHEPVALTLWCALTYNFECFEVCPYLAVTSPEKRSGKSVMFDVLGALCCNPWKVINPSAATLYYKLRVSTPTLLLDECDALFSKAETPTTELIRGILNAGNHRGTTVPRMVGQGSKMRLEEFPVYCPKAFAGIGKIPDTIADRSIPIRLRRKRRDEPVARFRRSLVGAEAQELAAELEAVMTSIKVREFVEDLPNELGDRAQDSWEPLIAIARTVGAAWEDRARRAAIALSGNVQDDDSAGVLLLTDIRRIFESKSPRRALASSELVDELRKCEESPWADLGANGLTKHALARRLKPYGIRPGNNRDGDAVLKGYTRSSFEDAWARYIGVSTATTATNGDGERGEPSLNTPDVAVVAVQDTLEGLDTEPPVLALVLATPEPGSEDEELEEFPS